MKKLIIIIALFLSYNTYAQYVPKAGNKLNVKPNGILVPTSTTDDTPIARAEIFNTGSSVLKPSTLPTASASVLGVVRVGTGLAIDGSGILSATGGGGGGSFVPYTGATSNVDLGANSLTSNANILTGVASPAYTQGKLVYDTDNQSLTFFNNDSNVGLQIGQEDWVKVVNNTGSTITNGSAVYVNGSSGGIPTIALARANAAATTVGIGLTTESIANGATGYVTALGVVRGLNTSAFSIGAVFISETTAGALTQTAPLSPNYRYRVGFVTNVDATSGTIHVTPSTGALGNGTANQVFGMNAAGTAQETKSITASNGVSITNGANSIAIVGDNFYPQPAVFTGGGTSTSDYFNIIGATGVSGTGALLMGTSPTMTTPTLGAATATTINKVTITAPTTNATLTLVQGSSLITAGAFSNTITTTANTTVTFPTTGTLYGTATGSITSAQLLASLSNETGTGTAVFSISPTFTGTPLAPTATAGTNTTQIATTAFVQAGLNEQVLSKTAAYTILTTDFGSSGMLTVYVNATSAAVTITLPSVANMLGKVVNVIKTDASANAVTVTGAANINGASTFSLTTQYNSVEIHSNNTQYYAK